MQRRRDEPARRAGALKRSEVLDVAHAAARKQLEVGKGGVDGGDEAEVEPGAAAHARGRGR
jgi:hypothetical protein